MDQKTTAILQEKIRMAKEVVPTAHGFSIDKIAFQEVLRYLLEHNVTE